MKIMHINSYFMNRFFYQKLYDEQKKSNELLVIIPSDYNYKEKYSYDDTVKIARCYHRFERFIHFVRLRKIVNYIEKNYKVADYDVIHAHSLFTNGMVAYLLAQKYGKPFVVNVRNVDVNIFFKYLVPYWKTGKKILNSASKVVFLSQSYKAIIMNKDYKDIDRSKCVIIPNGIDKFWLENKVNSPRKLDKNSINILYVGDINKNKNLLTVARAIDKINSSGINVSYTIVGEIHDRAVAKKIQMFSFVTIVEYVEKDILLKFYRKADIYVMASHTESFGLTYVEAMSQGLPVIYSKGQGFDGQFMEGDVGYHVDPKSYLDISRKIKLIIERYDELSLNCIEGVDKYRWEEIERKYQIIYHESVKDNKTIVS